MSKRRTFTPQQKSQIVLDLLKENKTIAEIAAEYEIHPNQLLRWKSEAVEKMHLLFTKDSDEVEKIKKKHDSEVEDLTKQIGQLTIEVNWLKKNLASNKEYTERCAMVEKDNKNISVKRQVELLSINRTSLYYKPVGTSDEEIALMHEIDRIYTRWPAFGYRRITAKLKELGYAVNRKRVQRFMRKMDGRGRATDNARIERFFRSLKTKSLGVYTVHYLEFNFTWRDVHGMLSEAKPKSFMAFPLATNHAHRGSVSSQTATTLVILL